jgi:hypothetical protein
MRHPGTGKETIVAQFEILSLYVPGATEEYHDNQDRLSSSPRFENTTSREQLRVVKHPTEIFVV